MNGRDLKNKAIEYLEEARMGAPNTEMMAELEGAGAPATRCSRKISGGLHHRPTISPQPTVIGSTDWKEQLRQSSPPTPARPRWARWAA